MYLVWMYMLVPCVYYFHLTFWYVRFLTVFWAHWSGFQIFFHILLTHYILSTTYLIRQILFLTTAMASSINDFGVIDKYIHTAFCYH